MREHGADIGLAFDGDADRCFVVDERGESVSPVRDHRAGRRPRAGQAPGRDDHPQPDHLAGGARDRRASTAARRCAPGSATRSSRPRWPRPARCSAASTRRTTTSATSGSPTPACSPRCTCWPRSASRTAPLSELPSAYARYVASGEINSTVADQAAATEAVARAFAGRAGVDRRRARRPHRRRRRTGGSTCGRPTPSRCCGSTSRRPTTTTMAAVRDEVLPRERDASARATTRRRPET